MTNFLSSEEVLETQLNYLIHDYLFQDKINQKKFLASSLELVDEEEKFICPIYQGESKISEETNFYFFFVDGSKTNSAFKLFLLGSKIENLFLLFLDLENEETKIASRFIPFGKKEFYWSSIGLTSQLELALLIYSFSNQGKIWAPSQFKTLELLDLVKDYLDNILNR